MDIEQTRINVNLNTTETKGKGRTRHYRQGCAWRPRWMDNYHTLDVAPVVLRRIQCAAATATCGGKFEALVKCLDRHQSLQLSSGFPSAKRLENWMVNTKLVLSTTAFEEIRGGPRHFEYRIGIEKVRGTAI